MPKLLRVDIELGNSSTEISEDTVDDIASASGGVSVYRSLNSFSRALTNSRRSSA